MLCTTGSSPHARGARNAVMEQDKAYGIIPACAGSTLVRRRTTSSPRDHPRMRGEHGGDSDFKNDYGGSSPHARGAHPARHEPRARRGIIPACAGSTRCRSTPPSACWDHPRMRGEHSMHQDWILPRWGSSPHTRGARQSARHGVAPRGSSPHARGALIRRVSIMSAAGIIPACAGSTSTCIRESATAGDHPRMRGEHVLRGTMQADDMGSSPHARGAREAPDACLTLGGIIPACAGSTVSNTGGR